MGMIRRCVLGLVVLLGLAMLSTSGFASEPAPGAASNPDPADALCNPIGQRPYFLLRSDFTDLGPLSCTHDKASAQGAALSWTNNLFTGQNSAAADGLAIVDYTCFWTCGPSFVKGYSIGPYLQFDDTYQFEPSKAQDTNGYTMTPGAFGEVLFRTGGIYSDIRLRDGEAFANTSVAGQSRANAFVAEWSPSFALGPGAAIGFSREFLNTPIYYVIVPELMVQHDHLDEGPSAATIFSTSRESLRVGPQVALQLQLNPADLGHDWFSEILGSTTTSVTNHESWDEYSNRQYTWTQVSFTYTPQPRGAGSSPPGVNAPAFGVIASYGYGNAEASGIKTNQIKIGLAVKF